MLGTPGVIKKKMKGLGNQAAMFQLLGQLSEFNKHLEGIQQALQEQVKGK